MVIILFSFNWLQNLELVTYDYRMILKSQFQFNTQKNIVLVTIDDQSIKKLGAWPWPRKYHAQLIRTLNQAGAKVIGFDILFHRATKHDRSLAQAIKKAGNVVLPYKLDMTAYRDTFDFTNTEYKITNIQFPKAEFKKHTVDGGYLNLLTDHDGSIRRLHLLNEDNLQPFAISLAKYYNKDNKSLEKKDLLLNFKIANNYFQEISYHQVLEKNFSVDFFQDKIVLIGAKGNSFQDYLATPLAAVKGYVPGMIIHATALDNYLEDSFMHELGTVNTSLVVILCSLLLAGAYYKLTPIYSIVISGIALSAVVIINLVLFIYFDLFVPLLPLVLVIIINLMISILSWYLKTEKRKNKLREIFSRYVAPEVVKEVLQLSEENYLQGKRREITVLFVDINTFTNFSESHAPQEVVRLLNKYFSLITEETFNYEGTLDKFIGDGAMIFFNAPTEQPLHANQAVKLAIALQNRINGHPDLPLSVSVGINTGQAVVGNIGSTKRSDYTAIGDVVNTAARIEGVTQAGEIYIGHKTWQKLSSEFEVQLKTKVSLKGKRGAQSIYKVIY